MFTRSDSATLLPSFDAAVTTTVASCAPAPLKVNTPVVLLMVAPVGEPSSAMVKCVPSVAPVNRSGTLTSSEPARARSILTRNLAVSLVLPSVAMLSSVEAGRMRTRVGSSSITEKGTSGMVTPE